MRHILGHGVEANHPQLLALLDRTQGVLRKQTEAWIQVLNEQGLGRGGGRGACAYKPTVMPGAVLKLVLQHGLMTEPDAWASVRKAVDFMPPAFYAPLPSPREAIDAIHAAGGLAVHAHPGSVPDQELMKEVLPMLDGLGVYPPPAQARADPRLRGAGSPARPADDGGHRLSRLQRRRLRGSEKGDRHPVPGKAGLPGGVAGGGASQLSPTLVAVPVADARAALLELGGRESTSVAAAIEGLG